MRIWLSPPDVGVDEQERMTRAIQGGWVAPAGPDLAAFEADIAAFTGWKGAVALSSGTAALHLALLAVGVQPGDEVLVSTFTFAASARQSPQDIWMTTESSFDPDAPGEIGQELSPWQELLPRDVFDKIWSERGASMLIVPREVVALWRRFFAALTPAAAVEPSAGASAGASAFASRKNKQQTYQGK
jgi:hypothetical protein